MNFSQKATPGVAFQLKNGRAPRVAHVTTIDTTLRVLLLGQLRRLVAEGYDVTAISAPGPDAAPLEAEGIRHVPWPSVTRAWDPRRDARAFAELVGILREGQFDVVHAHNPKPGIMARIAARLVGVPCVVNTVHGLYATPEDRPAKRIPVLLAERVAALFSDLELYQSEEDLAWARRIRLAAARKTVLLGNGCDLSAFDPGAVSDDRVEALRRRLGIPEGALVVGTIGRLVAEKGYRELFDAARRVRERRPGVAFLAVGPSDPDKPDALPEPEIERARVDVAFPGWVEDVPAVLKLMDVFVLPSWREGLPRSAVEAAAMGRPLVLTDIRGCREVARDGVEGLLVPVRDPERLAAAIEALAADPARRARLGCAARLRALERFDGKRVEDTIVEGYRRLLSGRRRRPVQLALKRAFDLAASAAGLVAISPVLGALAAMVRASMGSPVLFRQIRLGKDGRPFTLYKFRTMRDARDADGRPLPDEARITRVGRLLRRTSLDELPELVNVVRGELSVVGPRPLLPEYRDLYTPEQWRRHEMRPGLAGPVAARGRNALSWHEKFALDIEYVDRWSLGLDLKILAASLWKVIRMEGVSADGHATMPRFEGNGAGAGEPR